MSRKTKLILNSTSALLYQLVAFVCGFILPRYFLSYFGSEVNGLVSSITQFLGFVVLAECGVGAVVQSTLYRPLAEKDTVKISEIVMSSERFFRRIAYLLLGYLTILMVLYPLKVINSFDFLFTFSLIFVISISTFMQYYLGITYKILLNADQLGFVQNAIHMVAMVLNTVSCVILMVHGASIHIIKLTTSLIFAMQPILISVIAKRRYCINRTIKIVGDPIKQKWNGFAQHVAGVILANTDMVVLTLFSTLENVSIYSVYYLGINGVKQIILSQANGIRAMFGNMLAKNEMQELNRSFNRVEMLFHALVTWTFSVAAVLIIPFVTVYTIGITDAIYITPAFAYLITLAYAAYCYRLPYYMLVNAAGHYKQTQWSAIIEAVLNLTISVILVIKFGLVGVAVGTFVAMSYRTIYLVLYLRKNIIFRKIRFFAKHLVIDAVETAILLIVIKKFHLFYSLQSLDYLSWIILAIKVGLTAAIIIVLINLLAYGKKLKQYLTRGK